MLACLVNSGIFKKEMFYLTTHSTHFIYVYMALDICQRIMEIAKDEIRCRHYMGYSVFF